MNSEQQLRRLSYVGIEPPFPGRGHQALAALLALTVALLPLSANAASVASFIHRVLFLRRQPDGFRKRGSGHGRRRDLSFGLIFGRPHLGRGSFHRSRAGSPQGLRGKVLAAFWGTALQSRSNALQAIGPLKGRSCQPPQTRPCPWEADPATTAFPLPSIQLSSVGTRFSKIAPQQEARSLVCNFPVSRTWITGKILPSRVGSVLLSS